MASAKEQNRTQREYESDPSEIRFFHFLSLCCDCRLEISDFRMPNLRSEIFNLKSSEYQNEYQEMYTNHKYQTYFQLQSGSELLPDVVSCFWLLPSASIVQICREPDRFD